MATRDNRFKFQPSRLSFTNYPSIYCLLANRAPSTSTYVQRLSAEQTAIEARLVELGVDSIKHLMQETTINDPEEEEQNAMKTGDRPSSPSVPRSRAIDTKRRILARYVSGPSISLYAILSTS